MKGLRMYKLQYTACPRSLDQFHEWTLDQDLWDIEYVYFSYNDNAYLTETTIMIERLKYCFSCYFLVGLQIISDRAN